MDLGVHQLRRGSQGGALRKGTSIIDIENFDPGAGGKGEGE